MADKPKDDTDRISSEQDKEEVITPTPPDTPSEPEAEESDRV